jgi:hypothetical protein
MVFFGLKKTVRDTLVVSRIVRGTCGGGSPNNSMVFFGSKKTVRDTLVVSRIVRGTCGGGALIGEHVGAPFGCPHRGPQVFVLSLIILTYHTLHVFQCR